MFKKNLFNWLLVIVSLVFLYFVFAHRTEVVTIYNYTRATKYRWLFAAVISQLFAYFFITKAHQQSLAAAGITRRKRETLSLILQALVINTTVPSGGASGTILFAEDAEKRGDSPLAAASGLILLLVCYYIGILSIFASVFIYLKIAGSLGPVEVVCFLILLFVTVFFEFLLLTARHNQAKVLEILKKINQRYYKFRKVFSKKAKLSEKWTENVAQELATASTSIHKAPWKIVGIVLTFFIINFFNLLSLFFLFLAFGQIAKSGILVAGYAVGELFKVVSPAPEGVGITEVSMVVVFTSFGLDPLTATAVSLIYRGLNFWIPLAFGFAILQARHLKPKNYLGQISFQGKSKKDK